jgi:hypothetical protein
MARHGKVSVPFCSEEIPAMNAALPPGLPIKAHRAPDPAPIEEPSPEPFDTPHPHHQPGHTHTPQADDDPVPDPKPSMFA